MKIIFFCLWVVFLFLKFIKGEADQIIYEKLTKFAFLSCNNQKKKRNEALLNSLGKVKPQLLLWIGDYFYSRCPEVSCLNEAYEYIKKDPFYIQIKKKFKTDGIYDDHDYNVNNGDGTYKYKEISKKKFLDYLNIDKNDVRYKRTGSYISKLYVDPENDKNKVKIIILDTRYNKDPYPFFAPDSYYASIFSTIISIIIKAHCSIFGLYCNSTNDILGEEQWQWFEQELTNSTARAHIVISSMQIFSNCVPYESWGLMRHSLTRLKNLIKKTKPKGLLFLSGDVHFGSIIGDEENIVEVTSSSVNQENVFGKVGLWAIYIVSILFNKISAFNIKNMYSYNNYGTVEINYVNEDEIRIKTSINNSNGEEVLTANQTFNSTKDIYAKTNKLHIINDDFGTIICKSKLKVCVNCIVYIISFIWFFQILFILYKLSGIENVFKFSRKKVNKLKTT